MMKLPFYITALSLLSLSACVSEDILTTAERERQAAADYQVASLLFESDLSGHASYKVSKDAFVRIVFDRSVSHARYESIVRSLRTNTAISGVRAEQEGAEVCPLR